MGAEYSLHAKYWDWDGYDDSGTYRLWFDMAGAYGTRILSPMCAIGQAAAYMAARGAQVTALDLEPAMIAEGEKRFGHMENLCFICGDVCTFLLEEQFDFCFLASTDLHLLPDMRAVQMALRSINRHLRMGGGLGLEVWFAPDTSFASPMRRFEPRMPRADGLYIWKEGDGHYDAATKVHRIHQVVHIGTDMQFDHDVTLQLYTRQELLDALAACGFALKNEKDHAILELVKIQEI